MPSGGKIQHGHDMVGRRSPTYSSWAGMRSRCLQPTNKAWYRYGGRGIKICERWMKFDNFLSDMGPKPNGMTLDRFPDNNGDYKPENCRWATYKEQNNNRRDNQLLTVGSMTLSFGAWAVCIGMNGSTLSGRLKHGWSISRAFNTPVKIKRKL